MNLLYITADQIGVESGGGKVTYHESAALESTGNCRVWGRTQLNQNDPRGEPWKWDEQVYEKLQSIPDPIYLAHFYAGTFSKSIRYLKARGTKVTYTAAAHDVSQSKEEHERLGFPFDYPHLINPDLWKRYIEGYLNADVVICPSSHSMNVMKGFGCKRVEVIPHGVDLPPSLPELPPVFSVGYMGCCSAPDKGLIYLLQTWRMLGYKDSVLILAGRDSNTDYVQQLIRHHGGGNVIQLGWVNNISTFYEMISCYCQPSVTEGFGIEVLEAMSHGRWVICSTGAGACDLVPQEDHFEPRDVTQIARHIERVKKAINSRTGIFSSSIRNHAGYYTWDKIRHRYINVWRQM